MADMIEVTQADREAAADYAANGGWGDGREHWLANALDGHPLIQAFARHRVAALTAQREAGFAVVPVEPSEAMHRAARDWSIEKYGKAIGFDASEGCYRAMIEEVSNAG